MDDDYCFTSDANTPEESEERRRCTSEGPVDSLSGPTTETSMKNGEDAQTTKYAKRMEKKREKVLDCIAAFCCQAGIPLNAVCSENFHLMLEAIGRFGPCFRGPTRYELRGSLFQKQVSAISENIGVLKYSWAEQGCSIMLDSWTDDSGRRLMSLVVHSWLGAAFLRSVHLSSESHDDTFIFELLDSCIEEIGEKNVVHVVTNIEPNNMVAKMLTAKRPNIFWTQCAAHCIGLMLEDIGNISSIKNTVAEARSLTAFIYGCRSLTDMMSKFTNQQDLVQVGITRATTSYLNLRSLYDKRIELKAMFISKEWEDSNWSNEAVGEKFYNLGVCNKFWHRVLDAINAFESLVDVLRRMPSGVLSFGFIYGDLANAKKEIALRFEHEEDHYLPIWNIIDRRCDASLKTPLHLAGYYLNPYYCQDEIETENLQIFTDALVECAHNMYKDQSTQEKIVNQLKLYWTASTSFRRPFPLRQSAQNNPDLVFWWEIYGAELEELNAMAVRILRLTCGSWACERSWIEKIHEKKPCRATCKQFNDSAYVMVNLRLQAKEQSLLRRDSDPLVPYLPDDEEPYEWFMDMDDDGDAPLETHKDEISAILRGWPRNEERPRHSDKKRTSGSDEERPSHGSDEERPRHSDKKRKSSHASCSKRGKKLREYEPESSR